MDFTFARTATTQIKRSLIQNSPTILTGLGIAGFVSSIVMAVKVTPKAVEKLEDEVWNKYEEETDGGQVSFQEYLYSKDVNLEDYYSQIKLLEPKHILELSWRYYVPTAGMALISGAAIILANRINLQRNATLVSLYAIAETGLREYQDRVIDTIGEKKERKIREEVIQKKLDNHPLSDDDPRLIALDDGKELCYDDLSGRYFRQDIETLRQVQNEYNERLLVEMSLSLNELYSDMGIETIELGNKVGWAIEKGLMEFDFTSKLGPKGKPCVVIVFKNAPQPLWF